MNFPSLHRAHGLPVIPLDRLVPDYERRPVPIPHEIFSTYNLGGPQAELWRVRTCPRCGSQIKREPRGHCKHPWHRPKPKGWQRQP